MGTCGSKGRWWFQRWFTSSPRKMGPWSSKRRPYKWPKINGFAWFYAPYMCSYLSQLVTCRGPLCAWAGVINMKYISLVVCKHDRYTDTGTTYHDIPCIRSRVWTPVVQPDGCDSKILELLGPRLNCSIPDFPEFFNGLWPNLLMFINFDVIKECKKHTQIIKNAFMGWCYCGTPAQQWVSGLVFFLDL